ncbi:HD domain-containing protein [Pseudomonas sp.]|uniref:HD domain-containing protein n=1 Tax=Pseudomonas sp. TaxID=306 RepID=UPI000ABFA679|nr:HD domain-containing protein [Pseudomonas sp.]MDU4254198.1 HD domain-containing protein [Pseudomonas sp.]
MSATTPKVKASSGIVALVVMLAVVILGYSIYLESSHKALDFQAEALSPHLFMFKPHVVIQIIGAGGFKGTLVAVLVEVLHCIFAAAMAYSIARLVGAQYFRPRNVAPAEEKLQDPNEYECAIPGSSMMILLRGNKDPRTGEEIEGVTDTDPYNQRFFRCNRKSVALSRPPTTPIEHLELAVHELLAAHATVPASVGAHHADATLREHSMAIAKEVRSYMKRQQVQEPLAYLAGLAHDLDKLLAYTEKSPGKWAKNKDATHHNTYSAYIVRQLPEFMNLSPEDQNVLTLALRYYHHPAMLPVHSGPRVEKLIQALRMADGFVIRAEKQDGIRAAKESNQTDELIREALLKLLNEANINNFRETGNAEGWTKDAMEFVIIPMSGILEAIGAHLPVELSRQLQMGVDTRTFTHPAIPMMLETLEGMRLLIHSYNQHDSASGLFDVKIGVVNFNACVLLDKEKIQELVPGLVERWGMSTYKIHIRRPTRDGAAETESGGE